jgi:hypothetical protein
MRQPAAAGSVTILVEYPCDSSLSIERRVLSFYPRQLPQPNLIGTS